MDELAALAEAGIGLQRVERAQAQDALGVEGVGVAHQPRDVGDGDLPSAAPPAAGRARGAARAGCWGGRRRALRGGRGGRRGRAPRRRVRRDSATRRCHQRDAMVGAPPALRARVSVSRAGAGGDHVVVRREADPALRKVDAERGHHPARHPRPGFGDGGPRPLVEAAEDRMVERLQARLQRAQDAHGGVVLRPAHDDAGDQRVEGRRPVARVDGKLGPLGEGGQRLDDGGPVRAGGDLAAQSAIASACAAARLPTVTLRPFADSGARAARMRLPSAMASGDPVAASAPAMRPGAMRGPRSTFSMPRMPLQSSAASDSGCLRRASHSAAPPPAATAATRRANTPAGVAVSGSPAESSTAMFQRRSAWLTRRASGRCGVTSATLSPFSTASRMASATAAASVRSSSASTIATLSSAAATSMAVRSSVQRSRGGRGAERGVDEGDPRRGRGGAGAG